MSICTIPPAGWSCSREPGHEGPCAARASRPYDEHINRELSKILFSAPVRFENHKLVIPEDDDFVRNFSKNEIRSLLADAWMDGLKYSLVMIESEKRRRDDSQN